MMDARVETSDGFAADVVGDRPDVNPTDASADAGARANVYVAVAGNDSTCVRGNSAQPCASLDRAYAISFPGDWVQIGAGTYSGQTIHPSTANGKPSTVAVTFAPAPGAAVVFTGGVQLGVDGRETAPSYVTFDGRSTTTIRGHFSVNYNSGAQPSHDTLMNTHVLDPENAQGALVFSRDVSYLTVQNNDIGPACCSADGIGIEIRNNGDPVPDHIAIVGNRIHDLYDSCREWPTALGPCSGPGYGDPGGCTVGNCDHVDGLQAFGGRTLTIERNQVYLQGDHKQAIFMQSANGGTFANVILANNMVATTSDNGVSFGGPGTSVFSGFAKVLYNTFQGNFSIYNSVFAPGTPITIAGNILQGYAGNQSAGGCTMTYGDGSRLAPVWSNNLLGSNAPCGGGDSTGSATFLRAGWPGVTSACGTAQLSGCTTATGDPDLHLSGTQSAVDSGDTMLCGSGRDVSTDIDGTPRPLGAACDRGADELR
jgi:hypothetical protein